MNYYIADMHFSHANVLAYDNRPFLTAYMDYTPRTLDEIICGGEKYLK